MIFIEYDTVKINNTSLKFSLFDTMFLILAGSLIMTFGSNIK